MNVSLFDRSNIADLRWPLTPDGNYARRWLLPFIKNGPQTYIANVQTDLRALKVDSVILPLTMGRYHPANSYVCSPYNHYFAYGAEEFGKLNNRPLEISLRALLWPLFQLYRHTGFDRAVLVNNWLLSTNLYPKLTAGQAQTATQFLAAKFPNRPIVWRSVDGLGNPDLLRSLIRMGCLPVFSRMVYYQDACGKQLLRKKQVKIDLSKYRKTPYQLLDDSRLSAADAPRLAELYRLLYIDKYSHFNPQFTEAFFRLALTNKLLTFKAFRAEENTGQKSGDIDAVLGYFSRNKIMTQPVFGYDTHLPQTLGLYRLLSTQVLLDGIAHKRLINCSAGVGEFKRLRGGQAAPEYNAVYLQHLPARKQWPWRLLKIVLDGVAVPIIEKYGF
jgi:hypothetical protein